jgi:hypothetical protein
MQAAARPPLAAARRAAPSVHDQESDSVTLAFVEMQASRPTPSRLPLRTRRGRLTWDQPTVALREQQEAFHYAGRAILSQPGAASGETEAAALDR